MPITVAAQALHSCCQCLHPLSLKQPTHSINRHSLLACTFWTCGSEGFHTGSGGPWSLAVEHADNASSAAGCGCRDEDTDKVGFRGWARMAVPIEEFTIIEVRKPNVGENKPADVTADIVIDTSSKLYTYSCQHGALSNALRVTTDLLRLCLCLQQGCSYS